MIVLILILGPSPRYKVVMGLDTLVRALLDLIQCFWNKLIVRVQALNVTTSIDENV